MTDEGRTIMSIPPGTGKTAAGVGGVGGIGALLVWAIMSMQGEGEATRAKLERIAQAQEQGARAQELTAAKLQAFVNAAEKEHARAQRERDDHEDRLREMEAGGRRRR